MAGENRGDIMVLIFSSNFSSPLERLEFKKKTIISEMETEYDPYTLSDLLDTLSRTNAQIRKLRRTGHL